MDDELARNQRFLRETEQTIRQNNNRIIHQRIPPVTRERVESFSSTVAELRAEYIEAAFTFADGDKSEAAVDELAKRRRRFEEARDAFIALQRAIELGYMAVQPD